MDAAPVLHRTTIIPLYKESQDRKALRAPEENGERKVPEGQKVTQAVLVRSVPEGRPDCQVPEVSKEYEEMLAQKGNRDLWDFRESKEIRGQWDLREILDLLGQKEIPDPQDLRDQKERKGIQAIEEFKGSKVLRENKDCKEKLVRRAPKEILVVPDLKENRDRWVLPVHKEKKVKRENRGFKVLQALRGKRELPGLRVPQESLPLLQ